MNAICGYVGVSPPSGDHVIPHPQYGGWKLCLSYKTNLCSKVRSATTHTRDVCRHENMMTILILRMTQGQGVMPDGNTCLSYRKGSSSTSGQPLPFSEYTYYQRSPLLGLVTAVFIIRVEDILPCTCSQVYD